MKKYIHRFGPDGTYAVSVASDVISRIKAYELVYDVYQEQGYAKPSRSGRWVGIHHAHPETITVTVERRDEMVGTLSIVPDSPLGLPADELYADRLAGMRQSGRRLSEIVSLAVSETGKNCQLVVLHLCMFAYLVSREVQQATDMVITINPHHRRYYERRMHFVPAGRERTYGKVEGAPAVLLRCDLNNHVRIQGRDRARTIYRKWPCREEWDRLACRIAEAHKPMTVDETEFFLRYKTDIWEHASEEQREFLDECMVKSLWTFPALPETPEPGILRQELLEAVKVTS
jgi:hypothetical protein